MTQLLNTRLLILMGLILSVGMFTSCEKKDVGSTAVELLSFGPTGAKHGDTLRFIGNNLNKVSSIEFTGATVAQNGFIKQDREQILVKVPQAAEQGFVKLKTADGEIVSKTKLNLKVASSVTSITREARPGENITINGTYLNWVKRVTFARNKVVATFVSQAYDKLVVRVPDDAQTGPLVVFYGGTDSMDVQTADTLKVVLPVATALSPNPVKHQQDLTITGTNLDLAKQVLFTGVSAPVTTFVSQSATGIVVKVPAGAKKGKVTLVAQSGVPSPAAQEMEVVLPAITSFTPSPIDPGADLSITGTNLDLVTGVTFVGVPNPVTTFVSQSPTQLVVKVPAGTLKGKLTLGVLNSTLVVESSQVLELNGGLPPLADFALPIYTDGLHNTFANWSYTASHDFNSTANVRQGSKSIKATYGGNGYQGVTFHSDNGVATGNFTKLEFSVFAEAGLGGKKLNIVINSAWSSPTQVTLVEGEWTTFSLNLSTLGNPNPLKEITLQSAGWSGVLHIDHVGLR